MQFHLNGFHPGDPDIYKVDASRLDEDKDIPEEVDVLIVGCGPAGLTLAAQLSHFPEIKTRIIERKPGSLEKGQADGISCRSMEMFQAFGFATKIKREAHWINETTFWNPNPDNPDEIHRTGRIQDVEDGLSEMPHVILNQARVHDRYLEVMANSPTRLTPNYSTELIEATVDDSANEFPVSITLGRVGEEGPDKQKHVRAKYLVGCDGARSAVRRTMGKELRGDKANQAWGVMDVLIDTNFPDIRLKSLIKSGGEGNIIIIPREGGHLVRIYVEMDALSKEQEVVLSDVKVEDLIAAANRILNPYSIDVKSVAWWSIYEVGHRLTDKFDNVPVEKISEQIPRIFISGDACHTHSAKAGQGMNVSMGDSFNLGWKLVSVLLGRSKPDLLHSYSEERKVVAQDLIDFDHEWSRIIGGPAQLASADKPTPEFQKYFVEHGRYTAGLSVKYKPSLITGASDWQHLATGFDIGMRLHSAPVVRLIDAKPMELGEIVTADGRWRLIIFADAADPLDQTSRFAALSDYLSMNQDSPILRHTPGDADFDSIFDVCAVFQQHHRELDAMQMPELYRPRKGALGLRDHEKTFSRDPKRSDVFSLRGIDRDQGCMVVVRPDQYVSTILPLDAFDDLAGFFDGFMLAAKN
ncbi:MAG: FAD-dependent monooxygenase [Pseudomonadota bacterium]